MHVSDTGLWKQLHLKILTTMCVTKSVPVDKVIQYWQMKKRARDLDGNLPDMPTTSSSLIAWCID